MRLRGVVFLSLLAAPVASCGPVPVGEAEDFCAARFQTQTTFSGVAKAGISNGHPVSGMEVEIAPGVDFGDPSSGYNACVQRKSGKFPQRTLSEVGAGG